MANQRLNATITIGGAVSGTLRGALGTTKSKLQEIGRTVDQLKNKQKELNRAMTEAKASANLGAAMAAQKELGAINKQIDALRKKSDLLRREAELTARIGELRSKFRDDMFNRVGTAVALGATLKKPLDAFKDLDEAINNMQVAMTDATGNVPKQFEAIKKQTIELGNVLPGTTADFVNVATALKEQGVGIDSIVGGALKSASHLSVVMKMVPEQAGEMVAKLREAFQLSDDEFGKMADLSQKARFGFGLKPDDLLLGAKYYGGKLNALGLTGAENVRKIYALQGMAAQQGMDGSTFGTNFSMMLTRVGLLTERMHKNSKEMKAVNAELNKAGVKLSFFDKKGKFAGVDNMIAQLDKLKGFSQEKRLQILTRLFGEEGGRPADLIARNGVEGFKKALATMDKEASLDKRIGIATSSFKNQIEALGGTVTNMFAAIGEPIAEMFTPVMAKLNEIVGGPVMTWIEKNKEVVKGIGAIIAAVAGINLVGAAFAGVAFAALTTGLSLIPVWKSLKLIGGVFPLIARGFAMIGAAAMANPIGATIAAIAVGALLIYKYWGPLSAFATKLWDGITTTVTSAVETIGSTVSNGFATVGEKFRAAWEPIRNYFRSLWDDLMGIVSRAVEWISSKISAMGSAFSSLGSSFSLGGSVKPPAKQSSFDGGSAPLPSAPSGNRAPPPVPQMATARSSVSQSNTYNQTFNIKQEPGQSSDDLANKVVAKMKARDQAEKRGRMFDPVIAGAY
jgi:TP901 family phage tail tape measure protein